MDLNIRPERPADRETVYSINAAAFGGEDEARLVDALRATATPVVSLVAEDEAGVIGHILFSPVTFDVDPQFAAAGLAPMAVLADRQRRGVGSALVRAGLEACREAGFAAVVVLGHPEYYPRFAFRLAADYGIRCDYDVPEEAFMVLELQPGALGGISGLVRYHPAFGQL